MLRIEQYSPGQLDMINQVRQKWEAVDFLTGASDRQVSERAVDEVYKAAGYPEPEFKIWFDSPFAGTLAYLFLDQKADCLWIRNKEVVIEKYLGNEMKRTLKGIKGKVGPFHYGEIVVRSHQKIKKSIRDEFEEDGWFCCLSGKTDFEPTSPVSPFDDEEDVFEDIVSLLTRVIRSHTSNHVGDLVFSKIESEIGRKAGRGLRKMLNQASNGPSQAAHLAILDYFLLAFGLMSWSGTKEMLTLGQSSGWWWPFENAVILTERPIRITRDHAGRLHNESLKAVEYPDGWGVYALHGVFVPGYVIENPERITLRSINGMQNLEVRRVMIERYGMDRYLTDSGAELLQRDEFGELFEKKEERDEDVKMVKVQNSTPEPDGSIKDYFIRVPPWIKTAREAVAWTFDMYSEEYQPKTET